MNMLTSILDPQRSKEARFTGCPVSGGELKVTKQVVVLFSIGWYKDEVKCDVCPMDACHLLLGRSWQYDRRVIHDCFTNRYSFDHEGKKVILAPMSPREVYEDQIHLKASIAAWKANKEKITCENQESHTKVISASSSSSISSPNLQVESRAPSTDSEVAGVGMTSAFMCISEIQQPFLLRFDVPSYYPIDFSFLDSDPFGCKLGGEPCIVFLVECRDYDCSVELSLSFQLKEPGTPSASSFQLIEAPFSSTSALLAQLKLNNPEVAETHPVQERVSYELVDSKRGVLHLSMHMHNMCGSLGMLWACGRDLGTSQESGWLNQPLSLHLFPPKWCEHTLQMSGSQCIRPKGESAYNLPRSATVEDFFKEMEMAIMRANIVEDREATMARFLAGLNTEISNVVELQHYVELEDMVYMAIKVEKQQRRKTVNRGNTPSKPFSNSFNAPNNYRKPAPQAPLQNRERAETSKTKPHVADVGRGKCRAVRSP
ncbi:hypothetical protein GQ457_06G012420 [Hibiscus cannabinus]